MKNFGKFILYIKFIYFFKLFFFIGNISEMCIDEIINYSKMKYIFFIEERIFAVELIPLNEG